MCRPKSQSDAETPIIPASEEGAGSLPYTMSSAKDSQRLAKVQPRSNGESKHFPSDALDFHPQPIWEKVSPVGFINRNRSEPVPTQFKSKAPESTTKLTAKSTTKIEKKGKKSRPVIVVQHNYHDHSQEKEIDHPLQQKSRGGVSTPFPQKLHEMLDRAMAEGHGDIVSWQPHGRCFVVYKSRDFQEIVLPKYFKLRKLSSFQRQLNLYGFQRLTFGRDRGGYYHELFLRHKEFLSHGIKRVQVKGTGVRARSNPDQEPNFWTMKWCDPEVIANKSTRCEEEPEPACTTTTSSMHTNTKTGMQSTWTAAPTPSQSQPRSEQEPGNTWAMEWRDDRSKITASSGNEGRKFTTTNSSNAIYDSSTSGIPSFSEQEPSKTWTTAWCVRKPTASRGNEGRTCNTSSSTTTIDDSSRAGMPCYPEQAMNNTWTMEWCDRKDTTAVLSGSQGSKCTICCTSSYGDSSSCCCGMPPTSQTWNHAPISWEARNYQTQVTIPNDFQPIETKRREDSLEICGSSPAHHDMNVRGQHGSYGGSTSASAEDGNLVLSFGDKSFHYMDNVQPLSSGDQNMICSIERVSSNSFDPRTFRHSV